MANSILTLNKINKVYNPGEASEVAVLHDIDFEMAKGEFVAIMGPSGSGKSTLLNIIGLLDRPTSGTLSINGQNTSGLEDAELTHLRCHKIGFVFQYHYLISAFTALENVMMPLLVDHGFQTERAEQRAKELIDRVGLSNVADHRSNDMSGGQQQRVAIARGLAMNPDILLADEPTGNLDTENTKSIFDLLREVNRTSGTSILLITHNHDLGRQCDRIIQVVDGRIVS